MTVPYVSALPTPPSRADAANFAARADAFLGAQPTMATEMNALADFMNSASTAAIAAATSAVNAPGANGTSTSQVAIASSGDKTFTIQAGKAFVKGQWVQIVSNANVLNYMIGTIKTYDGVTGTLLVSVQRSNGSGTYSDWVVSLGGAVLSDNTPRTLAAGSTVKDKSGGTDRLIGFRGMPPRLVNTTYTVSPDDVGFCLEIDTGGSLVLPRNSTLPAGSQFAGGDIIVFQEIGGATKSLSPATGATLRQKGTTNTGVRTIKSYGGGHVQLSGFLADTWFGAGDLV